MAPPAFDDDPSFSEGVEDLAIEQFIAKAGVEALDVAILPRTAALDIDSLGADGGDPSLDSLGDELRSVIGPVSMTNSTNRVEIITSVQRRRRWTAPEKVRMVEETFEPGMTVSLVARRHGVAPNQLFTWRRLVAQGSLTAAGSGEEVVPASDYRALQNQVRELHRLLGKKTLEAEILKEALEHATGSKKQLRLPPSPPKDSSR